jgi:hypothetical protein
MKHAVLIFVATGLIVGMFFADPIAQDAAYHQFADTRRVLGIPNFWNVVSNLLFLYAGVEGFRFLAMSAGPGVKPALLPLYRVFFGGVLLTTFGSAWYHIGPANSSLVWDRLPMTLAFMSLFSIVLAEQVSETLGKRLLLPLLLAGAGSVAYWWFTEMQGRGDLRPYVLVQFLPMLLIPLILIMYSSRFDRTGFIWAMIVVYAVSKLFEYFDYNVLALGGIVSGHSVKHLVAALAPLVFLHGLKTRRPAGSTRPGGASEKWLQQKLPAQDP